MMETEFKKKGMGRGRKAGLISVVVLVAALAISNAWTYTSLQNQADSLSSLQTQVDTLQSQLDALGMTHQDYVANHSYTNVQYNSMRSQVNSLASQLNVLERTYQEYVAEHPYSEAEIEDLKAERDELKAPKLSTLSVEAIDIRPLNERPYLQISGKVWNLGKDSAQNCRLRIVAYQGETKAIDTYISLGTILGYSNASVDMKIYYEGTALTSVDMIPEWTV